MEFKDENPMEQMAKALSLVRSMQPKCVKCNAELHDAEFEASKCSDCGYDAFVSMNMCLRTHFKEMPTDLVDYLCANFIKGFKEE